MPDQAFVYLLNAMERAGQAENPADEGFADKRKAVLEHVDTQAKRLTDCRARLLSVASLLGEPTTEDNLRRARKLLEPLTLEAVADKQALRTADRMVTRT